MTPEEWKNIKRIFDVAVDLPAIERAVFLANGCDARTRREVEKMLVAEEFEDSLLAAPILDLKSIWNEVQPESPAGKKIRDYRIIREIGRGGMGAVYEAERDNGEFSQRVALKFIKRGMDSDEIIRRFRHERQILASLEHPNIARLVDGGVSDDGTPFYAMEFVAGVPIDEFCQNNNLSINERLKLFRQICAAVSFAHSRLVVHRDLKPSNVLVTSDKTVKLLDFGIAKVLSDEDVKGTVTQFGMMTPAYASPEQVRGETVSTATDVYSLGVILYELLADANPHKIESKSHQEIIRAICETEPVRPSSLFTTRWQKQTSPNQSKTRNKAQRTKSLKGDLDNIVLKALKKEPQRRYLSVEAFSEDIRRHLDGLPVSARPDTLSYRASKFIHRNRVGVFSAAFVILALLAGTSVAVWQAHRAEQQRALAEQRFTEVRQLANSFVFKYHDAIEKLPGSTAVREMLVKDATAYLDRLSADAGDDAELRRQLAAAYLKLGDVQGKIYAANIGDTAGAVESYRKAAILLENIRQQKTDDRAAKSDLVKVYDALTSIYMQRSGNTGEALEILQNAVNLQEELLQQEPENAEFRLLLARLYLRVGDVAGFENALPHYEKALTIARILLSADSQNAGKAKLMAMAEQRAGTLLVRLGDAAKKNNQFSTAAEFYQKSLPYNQRSLLAAQKLVEIEPDNAAFRRYLAAGTVNLAETLARCGQSAEANETIKNGLQIFEKIAAEDTSNREAKFDVSSAHYTFAEILIESGSFAEAAAHLEKALELAKEIQSADYGNAEVATQIKNMRDKLAWTKKQTAAESTKRF